MNIKALHILERFPDKSRSIDLLMAEDPEFRGICEDHEACTNALQHWAKSKEPESKIRTDEYQTLCQELEEEVTQALESLKPPRLD